MSKTVISILLAALAIRIVWALVQPVTPAAIDRLPDQREYLSLAQNLLQHGSLCFFDSRFGQNVYAYRMPGYPVFLAACGASVWVARVVQSVIDVSTLLAVFLIAKKLTGCARIGVIAMAIMAVNPFYIYFSSLILTETLFAALIAWAICFSISGRWFLSLLFLIAGTYVRPVGLLFLPLVLLPIHANPAARGAYRLSDVLRRCAFATLGVLACLFPWAWRNHQLLGVWNWTTTNAGVTLYDGFNPHATGASDQRFIAFQEGLKSINEVERNAFFEARAKDWIGKNWRAIPGLSLRKILRGWSPVPLSEEFGRRRYRLISAAYCVPFDLVCAIGLFSRRLCRRKKMLLILPAVIVTVAQVMSVGSIRYRMPSEAMLAVLASIGVAGIWRRKFEERNLE